MLGLYKTILYKNNDGMMKFINKHFSSNEIFKDLFTLST